MPIVKVDIGKRNPAAFNRAVQDLKGFGFTYTQNTKLWSKLCEPIHIPRLLQSLRDCGLRGQVHDDVKPRDVTLRKEATQ
jgi:hypothetical protein